MAYFIDCGIWSSVFAVPTVVVDDHLRMCPPLSLRILLWMLRNPGPVEVENLAQELRYTPADISDALQYWISTGILKTQDMQPDQASSLSGEVESTAAGGHTVSPAAFKQTPAVVPPQELLPCLQPPLVTKTEDTSLDGQRILTINAQRPRLTLAQITRMGKDDPGVGALVQEAQHILGQPLSALDSEIIVALYSYYGFSVEVILMMLQYCVSIGKTSLHYVEKLAAKWAENEINTLERAETEIRRLTQNSENEKKIMQAFGIHNRALTAREREYIFQWYRLGMDERLFFIACERAVENTGKISFAYADKIITSWKTKGILTPQAAVDDLKNNGGKRPAQNISAQTGESSIDKEELHELLHTQFL